MTGNNPKGSYLYNKVHEALQEEILSGRVLKGELLPSEKEISSLFGVERTTVRRALELLVHGGLVEKQAGVGTRVVFEPEPETESEPPVFSGRQGNVIGFFMTDSPDNARRITQPYYSDLFYYLEVECKAYSYQLIYSTVNSDTDMRDIMSNHNFHSVVFVTQTEKKHIEAVLQTGVPVVLINESYENVTTISYDSVSGAYRAMQYLIEMGHRDIAIITGIKSYYTSREKLAGCYMALAENRISLNDGLIMEGDWEFQSGYDCARRLFSRPEPRPTAVFAFNDMMAIGVMRALKDLNIPVPQEVSVVGFDNMEQLQYTEPGLTTVDTHVAFLAHAIINNVVNQHNPYSQYGVRLSTSTDLIIRETVRRLEK